MNEPRPLGRVSPIRIPAGKESEYGTDRHGDPVHLTYGRDEELPGVVLPSAKHFREGGGSPGFDVEDITVKQNIVTMDGGGFQVIQQTTRKELAGIKAAGDRQLSSASTNRPHQLYGSIGGIVEEGGWAVAKKSAKTKKVTKRRANNGTAAAPASTKSSVVPVQITGPFGTTTQYFTALIRDGICLVLIQDHRELGYVYALPKPQSGEPVELTLEWADQRVRCFWAGISWTMPDNSATFIVLLVAEEPHGEGLSG